MLRDGYGTFGRLLFLTFDPLLLKTLLNFSLKDKNAFVIYRINRKYSYHNIISSEVGKHFYSNTHANQSKSYGNVSSLSKVIYLKLNEPLQF